MRSSEKEVGAVPTAPGCSSCRVPVDRRSQVG